MSTPVFRNPDKFQQLQFRDWIREKLPSGSAGVVVEDLDLVMRVYGYDRDTDAIGKFALIELKHGLNCLRRAQRNTFKLIDSLLRQGDPSAERYLGYFLLNYTDEDWHKAAFLVNHVSLDEPGLIRFLQLDAAVIEHITTHGTSPLA